MAKRIGFISPVDHLSGNLSGKQSLEYPTSNNRAFEAPDGKQYAQNYKPRFIGAMRKSDGMTYFAVKTKSAVKNTTATRLAMAALGAAGSLSAVLMEHSVYGAALLNEYNYRKAHGATTAKSFRAWLVEVYRGEFLKKSDVLVVQSMATPGSLIQFNNPYNTTQYDPERDITLPMEILVKFWKQLCANPITFHVGLDKGIAKRSDTFATMIASNYNVLGMQSLTIGGESHVCSAGSTTEAGFKLEYDTGLGLPGEIYPSNSILGYSDQTTEAIGPDALLWTAYGE